MYLKNGDVEITLGPAPMPELPKVETPSEPARPNTRLSHLYDHPSLKGLRSIPPAQ